MLSHVEIISMIMDSANGLMGPVFARPSGPLNSWHGTALGSTCSRPQPIPADDVLDGRVGVIVCVRLVEDGRIP